MSDKTKIIGLWWLPDSPNERWTGTLTVGPDISPKLKLVVPKGFLTVETKPAPKVIHGHDTGGMPITILFPGMPMGSSGMAISQPVYSGGYVIHGIELNDPDQFLVNSLVVKMQHLHEWSGLTGFQKPGVKTNEEFLIRYKRPEKSTFIITDDLSVEFAVFFSMNNGHKNKSMEEETHIVFKSRSGFTLKQSFQIINAIRHLLHFATLDRIYPISTTANKDGYGQTAENHFYPQDIHIYSSNNRLPVKPKFSPDRWLFQFLDVESRFVDFFAGWLAFIDKFHEPLGSYSATVYHRFPSEMENLCLAQALEAYHGIKFGKEDFVDRISALTSQCLPHLSGLVSDVTEFSKAVRDNRNYFTHHDPECKKAGRVVSGAPLIRLNEKMRLIFQMCVLSEIGISSDRFIRLRRQLASEIVEYLSIK
jgi:ApeA N-terminal domain 1